MVPFSIPNVVTRALRVKVHSNQSFVMHDVLFNLDKALFIRFGLKSLCYATYAHVHTPARWRLYFTCVVLSRDPL